MTEQEHLRQWLIDHWYIAPERICKDLQWKERSQLIEFIKGERRKKLPPEKFEQVCQALKIYGFEKK